MFLLLSVAVHALAVSSSHVTPTPASFDIDDANRTLHLAWTAFCNESAVAAWNCQWCSGPSTYDAPLEMVTYLKDPKAGTQGYVAVDYPRQRVVQPQRKERWHVVFAAFLNLRAFARALQGDVSDDSIQKIYW